MDIINQRPQSTTNVEIVSQSPPSSLGGRRRDSSTSSVGTNTEIEVYCTTAAAVEPSGGSEELRLAGLPAALFGDQPFEKGKQILFL